MIASAIVTRDSEYASDMVKTNDRAMTIATQIIFQKLC